MIKGILFLALIVISCTSLILRIILDFVDRRIEDSPLNIFGSIFIDIPCVCIGAWSLCHCSEFTHWHFLIWYIPFMTYMLFSVPFKITKIKEIDLRNGKTSGFKEIYECVKSEVIQEPKTINDVPSVFEAYKLKKYKQYKKEKWDEHIFFTLFSNEETLKELINHKLDISEYTPTKTLEKEQLDYIKSFLDLNSNDSDIDLSSLSSIQIKVDDKYEISWIVGKNKNLSILYNQQFLCYMYTINYVRSNRYFVDYSIDNLIKRLNNFYGVTESLI